MNCVKTKQKSKLIFSPSSPVIKKILIALDNEKAIEVFTSIQHCITF